MWAALLWVWLFGVGKGGEGEGWSIYGGRVEGVWD